MAQEKEEQKPAKKMARRYSVGLNQLLKRREELIARRAPINEELEKLDAAILALE